ncbi:hypothetical protein EJB05_42943, partial [Eragrostis curvula]
MKGEGKGVGAAAAALLLVLLVSAMLHTDAAVARRLGTDGGVPVGEALAGPKPNPCTNDPNNSGPKCHGPPGPGLREAAARVQAQPPAVSVDTEMSGHNNCTNNPNGPGKNCHHPPGLLCGGGT